MGDLLKEAFGGSMFVGPGFAEFVDTKSVSEARHDLKADPLEGKSKTNAKNWVLGKINKHTRGVHRDEYWQPVQAMFKEMERLGIKYIPTGGRYEEEVVRFADGQRHRVPVRKKWTFEIDFMNNRDGNDKLYGVITATGNGPVETPLDSYDVNVTLS